MSCLQWPRGESHFATNRLHLVIRRVIFIMSDSFVHARTTPDDSSSDGRIRRTGTMDSLVPCVSSWSIMSVMLAFL